MTKLRKIILLPALFIVCISGFFSCGVDRWPEYAHQIELDSWMYDIMQENYLWYGDMPSYDDVNLFLDPEAFLAKVKSKRDSYSFVDSVLEAPLPTYGFDYSLVRNPDIDTAYNALITYVIPESPAAKAGLKRGDWIVKVDTSYISKKYETVLLQGVNPIDITTGTYQKVPPVEPPVEGEEPEDVYKVVISGTAKIGAAVSLEDNPVHAHTVLTLSDGTKVGYIMYSSFTAGTNASPEKFNDDLRKISDEFSQQSIDRVILDLRYNKGGSIDCVQLLATLLVSPEYFGKDMAFLEYNDKNISKDATLTFDQQLIKTGKNLNVSKLIILTSGDTAGAPEMLINSLNGKINLIGIGSNTKGQNVGTEKFINEKFLWAVNPVVCTVYNSEHDTFEGGFKPTYAVSNASSDYLTFLPFGDPKETLLSVAIGVLEGTYPPKDKSGSTSEMHIKIEKSFTSPASRHYIGGRGLRIN